MSITRERRPNGIEILRLDLPERRNALDTATIRLVVDALDELAHDDELRVLVLSTTSVTAFCAGADVGEVLDREGGIARMEAFTALYSRIEDVPVPTIAVCVGNVVGAGAEIAAGCDLRVAGDNLKMAWAGAKLGVPVGPARLVPLIGLARAKELVYTGRVLGADEAAALGLVQSVSPAPSAEEAALELATLVAGQSADGVRTLKTMFRHLEDMTERIVFENDLLMEFQREGGGLPQG